MYFIFGVRRGHHVIMVVAAFFCRGAAFLLFRQQYKVSRLAISHATFYSLPGIYLHCNVEPAVLPRTRAKSHRRCPHFCSIPFLAQYLHTLADVSQAPSPNGQNSSNLSPGPPRYGPKRGRDCSSRLPFSLSPRLLFSPLPWGALPTLLKTKWFSTFRTILHHLWSSSLSPAGRHRILSPAKNAGKT